MVRALYPEYFCGRFCNQFANLAFLGKKTFDTTPLIFLREPEEGLLCQEAGVGHVDGERHVDDLAEKRFLLNFSFCSLIIIVCMYTPIITTLITIIVLMINNNDTTTTNDDNDNNVDDLAEEHLHHVAVRHQDRGAEARDLREFI